MDERSAMEVIYFQSRPFPTVLGNGRDWKIVAQYGTNTSSKCPYVLPPSRSQTACLSCFALPHYGVGTESAANRLWLSLPLTTLTTAAQVQ